MLILLPLDRKDPVAARLVPMESAKAWGLVVFEEGEMRNI